MKIVVNNGGNYLGGNSMNTYEYDWLTEYEYDWLTEYILDCSKVDKKTLTEAEAERIIKDFRFWFPLEVYEPIGFGLCTNNGTTKMMLCRLEKDLYAVKSHIIPIDEQYKMSGRTAYSDDILNRFYYGDALPFEEGDYLEAKSIRRYITDKIYEVCSGEVLYNKNREPRWTDLPMGIKIEEAN